MTALLGTLCVAASGETVVLKNGSFVEGRVILQTATSLRVKTRFGTRTFSKKDIEQVMESVGAGEADDVKRFAELQPVAKAVLNAEADYQLKNYDSALGRLQPLRDYQEQKVLRSRIDWLIIEITERLGKWDEAKKLLQEKQERGTPAEKIRAKAHLDIFEVNPDYDLRFVGKKHARNFLARESLRTQAREPGSLKDDEIMRLALEEYCEQLLVEDKQGVKAFSQKLDPKATYEALKKAAPGGDITRFLPYMNDLKAAEASILKAQAVLGDYGEAFELDLVRTELNHLLVVWERLGKDALQVDPDALTPPSDPRTGQLTAAGREQWQKRCDDFLAALRPIMRLQEYIVARTEPFPRELRNLRDLFTAAVERGNQTIKAVKKARDRTHV